MQKHQTRELCGEHNVYLPCAGCRADELVSTGRRTTEAGVTDARRLAAGDREDDDR